MDLIIKDLSGYGDIALPLSAIFSVIAVSYVVLFACLGLMRGMSKSVLRLIFVALAAAAAFAITLAVTPSEVDKLIASYDIAETYGIPAELHGLVSGVLSSLISPVVFTAMFICTNAVGYLLFFIISLIAFPRKKYKKTPANPKPAKRLRLFGMIAGIITGVVVFVVLYLPIYGYSSILSENSDIISQVTENSVTVVENKGVGDTVSDICYGDEMFAALTVAELDGEKICITEEVDSLLGVAGNVVSLSAPVTEWGEAQKAAIAEVGDVLCSSGFVKNTVTAFAESAYNSFSKNQEWFGIEPLDDSAYGKAAMGLLSKLADGSEESYKELISVIADVAEIAVDSANKGYLSENGIDMEILNDSELLPRLLECVLCTRIFDEITVDAVNSSLEMMGKQLGIDEKEQKELTVELSVWENTTDEQRKEECKLLASLIPECFSAGEGEETGINMEKAVEGMQNSILYSGAYKKVLDIMLRQMISEKIEDPEIDIDITKEELEDMDIDIDNIDINSIINGSEIDIDKFIQDYLNKTDN